MAGAARVHPSAISSGTVIIIVQTIISVASLTTLRALFHEIFVGRIFRDDVAPRSFPGHLRREPHPVCQDHFDSRRRVDGG